MISDSDRISRREEINELFEQLGQLLKEKVEILLIGGAVMLEMGLKDATKDIDVVCRSGVDKDKLLAVAKALGFEIVGPEKRHKRLGAKPLAVKGGRILDLFAQRISYDFDLSEAMWQRAKRIRSFGCLVIRDASLEDIYIMKLIANRPGDASDCSSLVIAGLDYNAIYRKREAQYRKGGETKEKVWINYIEEGIARLLDSNLTIPIGDKISLFGSGVP
ncbi:MAG: hypothetical protein A4E49_02422 [Methanosaeta sp. PtaU1.Bin112]|nr:MAG: hypothetical protein A4E49_02422 [Methanosaeta sp. PtaU1.Bin112]